MQRFSFVTAGWLVVAGLLLAASASAQVNLLDGPPLSNLGAGADDTVVAAGGVLVAPQGGQPAMLYVTADLAPGWHIYSLTQPKGGPLASKIKLNTDDLKLLGPFEAVTPPERHRYPDIWPNVEVEEHAGTVVWRAAVELAAGVDPATLLIHGAVNAQACAAQCLPPKDYEFVARLGDPPAVPGGARAGSRGPAVAGDAAGGAAPFRQPGRHTALSGYVSPRGATAGSTVELVLEATPDAGYHTYAYAARPTDAIGSKPTLIVLEDVAGWRTSPPAPDAPPIAKPGPTGAIEPYHDRPVRWTIRIDVPGGAAPGRYPLAGLIGYQSCDEEHCDLPSAARFTAAIEIGASRVAGATPLAFGEAKYAAVAKAAAGPQPAGNGAASRELEPQPPSAAAAGDGGRLWYYLGLAFLGGIILNVMPCVLPVIGLKVLSFIEQSQHDRRRVFMLNVAYALGVLSLMLVLATLVVVAHYSWGQQNQSAAYNITMAAIIFAMGLALLGVWEIPIPGLFTSQRASTWAAQEGYWGAFAKGIVTTVLATSCIAPLLGTAMGWAVQQSPAVIYATFALVALGLALPYLVIGAFPALVKFLPKPGMWMDTFKQMMGFLLLATVVFILSFLHPSQVVPTVGFLFGLWAACWWIGRTPWTESRGKKLVAWCQAVLVLAACGWFSFGWLDRYADKAFQARVTQEIDKRLAQAGGRADRLLLDPARGADELPWLPFSEARLAQALAEGKTVMIDFTADWCLNCQYLLHNVLNTAEVKALVERNGVVPLVADWTGQNEEISLMLRKLQSGGVPVLAIFPAGSERPSTVFRDMYQQPALLDALRRAGPSRDARGQLSSAAADRRGS